MHLRLTDAADRKAVLVPVHDLVVAEINKGRAKVATANYQGEVVESFGLIEEILGLIRRRSTQPDLNEWDHGSLELHMKYIR